jgi:Ca-activated chloride channel family protein
MTKRPNFYTLLGLPRSATVEDIRRSYLKAAKRLHPDKNVAPGETELFLDVQQAYQVLTDPAQRKAYDANLPPEEEDISIVDQRILVSRKELTQAKEAQLVYVLADFSPKKELFNGAGNSTPLNICLVLDCSTSMKNDKLDTVKATAIQLLRKLAPQDILSIVTFSDHAEVTIPATRQGNIPMMENRIRFLQASGGTEIFQGLQAGLNEVRRYGNPAFINHIILLTDGHTYGDEQASYELAKDAATENIGISGMGIGSGWNDTFLDRIASLTGGYTMLVSQPSDIERLLTEKFTNLTQTYAENVTFEYELGEGIELGYAFRLQPETAPLMTDSPLHLGSIMRDRPLTVLLEFNIKPQAEQTKAINLLQGTLEISAASLQIPSYPIPINIVLPVNANAPIETPAPPLIQALSKLTLYRIQEKARKEMANGDYEQAAGHLQKLATRLLAQGERSLAKTIMLEIEHVNKENAFSESGEKQIKYGTRALMLPQEHKI